MSNVVPKITNWEELIKSHMPTNIPSQIPFNPFPTVNPLPPILPSETEGLRYDQGKAPLHLLPPELLTEVAKVLDFGAKKYAPRNWEKGMDWSRVYSSLMRHLLAWWNGEDNDPETGLPHVAHIATNAAFLVAYNARNVGKDDRPVKEKTIGTTS